VFLTKKIHPCPSFFETKQKIKFSLRLTELVYIYIKMKKKNMIALLAIFGQTLLKNFLMIMLKKKTGNPYKRITGGKLLLQISHD